MAAAIAPLAVFACKLPSHGQHLPHLMVCVRCGHRWVDCPGESGTHYKSGCGKCCSIYWTAEAARQVGKLKSLMRRVQ